MAINILIGIGGTGAKIVESALHLFAAGIGPRADVTIGLVDQDNANGNVLRTEQLFNLLADIRKDFESPESDGTAQGNYLDWTSTEADGGTGLFGTRMLPLLDDGPHWRPADDKLQTLDAIMLRNMTADEAAANEKALFGLLFRGDAASEADEEQKMDLSEGYRGRAHVGSAALISAMQFDSPEFGKKLKALIDKSKTGNEVRIFLAGSLFGGTGAAGFPTIARMLDNLRHTTTVDVPNDAPPAEGVERKSIFIGGALMFPYFEFAQSENEQANVVKSTQLLPQARVAIEFYENLQRSEKPFDRLYAAGWDTMVALGYHKPGGEGQCNPALMPELVAALAAVDFFTLPPEEMEAAKPLAAARNANGALTWDDLPVDARRKPAFKHQLASALRFAIWWSYWIEPAFKAGDNSAWPQHLSPVTGHTDARSKARVNLAKYSTALLQWAASLQLFTEPVVGRFDLWDSVQLCSTRNAEVPTNPVTIHANIREERAAPAFDAFLHIRDAQSPPAKAEAVHALLSKTPPLGKSRGLGQLVSAVHRVARPVHQGNAA